MHICRIVGWYREIAECMQQSALGERLGSAEVAGHVTANGWTTADNDVAAADNGDWTWTDQRAEVDTVGLDQ